jgi:hypothetical protein
MDVLVRETYPPSPPFVCRTNAGDFRVAIATYAEFLWTQLWTADSRERPLKRHLKQPFWGEIIPFGLTAVRHAHPGRGNRKRGTVTPYVGGLFDCIFGDDVEVVTSGMGGSEEGESEEEDSDFTPVPNGVDTGEYTFHHEEYNRVVYPRCTTSSTGRVRVGDVVELEKAQGTRWTKSTQKWYAFVRDIQITPKGDKKLKIIWLYWPEDTALCMSMKYPHPKEVSPRLMALIKVILQ